jgi:hypothetical protein
MKIEDPQEIIHFQKRVILQECLNKFILIFHFHNILIILE